MLILPKNKRDALYKLHYDIILSVQSLFFYKILQENCSDQRVIILR